MGQPISLAIASTVLITALSASIVLEYIFSITLSVLALGVEIPTGRANLPRAKGDHGIRPTP